MDAAAFSELMTVAIAREMEASRFYKAVARKAANPDVKEIFTQLADDELGHRKLLERFRADTALAVRISPPPRDTKVAEATVLPPLSIDMKPADAIGLAMKKEQQAVEFYRGLAAGSTDAEVRGVFENLANMELGHKTRLEDIYLEVGYPEAF